MKVIFLDIDGVLNTFQTFKEINLEEQLTGFRRVAIDIDKVLLLKEIVEKTGAKLVLSSGWRKYGKMKDGRLLTKNQNLFDINQILNDNGLYIYDLVPYKRKENREVQIKKWLSKNLDVESFIIFDDEEFDLQSFINQELLKTSFYMRDKNGDERPDLCGLTRNHVIEAINKLNNSKQLIKI